MAAKEIEALTVKVEDLVVKVAALEGWVAMLKSIANIDPDYYMAPCWNCRRDTPHREGASTCGTRGSFCRVCGL